MPGRSSLWAYGIDLTNRFSSHALCCHAQEMEKRLAAGPVEQCSEMRACGTFVCEYERLYNDDAEPMVEETDADEQSDEEG